MWNPLSFGGQPYFANSATGLAYRPRVLMTAILNLSWTHDVYVMLHLFTGALAMFAFMRSLKVGFEGAACRHHVGVLVVDHGLGPSRDRHGPLALLPVALC